MGDVTAVMQQLNSPDGPTRIAAEQIVSTAQENDFAGFCIALLTELQDEAKPALSRMMAGLVLKNSVALDARSVEKRELLSLRWKSLGPEIRGRVKTTAVATLGSSDKQVRLIASLIIANLARIEFPFNEWPDLIDTLVLASGSGAAVHMEAALTALGYLGEEAANHEDMAKFMEAQSEKMLRVICAGMEFKADNTVIEAATRALLNSLEFIHDHMSNPQIQNFIITTVCNSVDTCQNEQIRQLNMSCLVAIADLYYKLLPTYIDRMFNVTTKAIEQDSEPVALQALLFWITIAEKEKELMEEDSTECHNLIKQCVNTLITICIACLQKQDDGQTEEDWNISIAGSKLLLCITDIIKNEIIPLVLPFIYEKSTSANWREKEAALMAFGSIMSGPKPETFYGTVSEAIPMLLGYVSDSNHMVADTAAWVLSVVCDLFDRVFIDQPEALRALLEKIGPYINSPDTTMSVRACNIIYNLALHYDNEEKIPNTNSLSQYVPSLCEALFARISRDDYSEKGKGCGDAVEALNTVIDAAARDMFPTIQQLVPQLLNRLSVLVQMYQTTHNSDLLLIEGLLCGSLNALSKKIGEGMEMHVDNIVNLLGIIFQQETDYYIDEAIMLMGSLANASPVKFQQYLPHVLPLIVKGTLKKEEESVCNASIGVIGDFANAYGSQFSPFVNGIIESFFIALNDQNFPRDLKIPFFGCIGDIALSVSVTGRNQTYPLASHIEAIMNYIRTFFQESTKIDFSADLETEDYVMDLWSTLCEASSQITQSLEFFPKILLNYVQMLIGMAEYVCRNRTANDTFADSITLFGDIADIFIKNPKLASSVKGILLTRNIEECIEEAKKNPYDRVVKQANWTKKLLNRLQAT